jgi:cation diffusion facilitator family transporter
LAVNCAEAFALGVGALVTGSVALTAQTATNVADVSVAVFLLIGVVSSGRPPDESHPLGYGREGFFWSLFAALGIFIGGGGVALEQAVDSALHPSPVHSYLAAYGVLAATCALDAFAFEVAARPVRKRAAGRGLSLRTYLPRSTDPAATTVVLAGGCAVVGALVATAGLAISQTTNSPTPDTVAGGLIGTLLLATSIVLLRANRELLTGRGIPPGMLREMRLVVAAQPEVEDVRDLFAVVVGPGSLVVNGDVTFADNLDVPGVEETIARIVVALRERWASIEYVYLTPVPEARSRRAARLSFNSDRAAQPPKR